MTNEVRHRRGDLTGQPDNQSLTIIFVGDFLFVARFLLGFGGFLDDLFKFKRRSVGGNTIL
jgi:hypothetical protein